MTDNTDSSVVTFDQPETITYTIPSGSEYGDWANKTIQLQFNGFGNLQGIPGQCISPTTNSAVDCATGAARYVPVFALPDGATLMLASSSTQLIVKALDTEVRLAIVNCSETNIARPDTVATMPSDADLHDPNEPADTTYIGDAPTVTDTPKVIGDVIQ